MENKDVLLNNKKEVSSIMPRNGASEGNIKYRSEAPYGEGIRDIISVLVYETYSLGNTDALEYITEHYLFGPLKDDARALCKEFEENGFVDDFSELDWEDFYRSAINEIDLVNCCNLRYCLWLADKSIVKDYYCDKLDEFDICGYEISLIKLSDLGHDGALYAYETMPTPISEEVFRRSA